MFTHRNKKKEPEMILALVAILGIIFTAITYSFSEGISGNDFWWHIKVGQWVIQNGSVPTTDIFSWYGVANQIPWTAHEWLSDVILYLVYNGLGQIGIFMMSLLAALVMVVLLWREARQYVEKNILIGGLFFVLFAVTTSVFFYGRPHMFSFFLLYWELKVLFAFMNDPSHKGIYTIPLLTCLWSNLHGGSASLAYGLCAVFLVLSLLKVRIGCIEQDRMEKKAIIKLAIVTVCTVAALLLNPVGLEVLTYPYKSFGDAMQMTFISEWRSPDAKDIADLLLFLFPVALLLIGFFAEGKKIRLTDLAVMGVFVFLFLRSVRFIMLWYIAAVFCAFPYVPACRIKPMKKKTAIVLTVVCLVIFGGLLGVSGVKTWKTAREGKLISTAMSQDVVEAIKKDAPERLFNDYNLGETLIYNDIPVFFDARADLYAYENMMADGVSLTFLEQANTAAGTPYVDVEQLLEKYGFDAIVTLKSRALYGYILSHPDRFTCVYENDAVGYFRVIG